ncbi:MAG: adenylate/guanylate cyclase domain-containing protein [Treponema sp.]|nr:adenylate/guanylate cyclase domain-containing protein [Treponema sp.]
MSSKRKQHDNEKISFSIGAKLIIIISVIVILSLGSITALVYWLGQADLQISAEENNIEMNRRSAAEAETLLASMRASSRFLIQTAVSQGRESINFFWTENPQIASVFFIIPGRQEQLLVNDNFFVSREIDRTLAASFFNNHRAALERAVRGETVLKNAAPHFSEPMQALFFPWQNGGAGAVLFSSETLNQNFSFGLNRSYMINTEGEVLSHSDYEIIRNGKNIADLDFIRTILAGSERSRQMLLETDFGITPSQPCFTGVIQELLDRVTYYLASMGYTYEKKNRQYIAYTKLNAMGAVVITSVEYDKIFEGITAAARRNICLTIVFLIISIIFIWSFSKTISSPLKKLSSAARQIEAGDFKPDVHSKSRDETGVLASNFQKMCSALRVFGTFADRKIAVKAMRGEIEPDGLQKHGTVFYSGIHDFAVKSEAFARFFGAEASGKIIQWLNNYFTRMAECVEKTDGIVDKFIGDKLMAHWGAAYTAGSPRKDAFNCIKAALMMRKALYYMNKERRTGDPANPVIRIGCGINSGLVTAGQLGSDKRMEYTVIGDPVDLALRIEELTKSLCADILISENTWKLTGDKFLTEEMHAVTVRGMAKPVRIFAVINFSGEIKGPQSLDDVRSLLGMEQPELEEIG